MYLPGKKAVRGGHCIRGVVRFVLLALVMAGASASGAWAADPTVSGTVWYVGQPLADADMLIEVYTDACDPSTYVTDVNINADGTYSLSVPPGTYYFTTFDLNGVYGNEWWAASASTTDCAAAQSITVVANQNVSAINFQLIGPDADGDGVDDLHDVCENDPYKPYPWTTNFCGCGVPDVDNDSDNTPDCLDGCINDDQKTAPGVCGCGEPDILNACGTCGTAPVEICDGIDNDCDGLIDEDVTNVCGTCGVVPVEICDGIDNDCDGLTDEGVTNACGACGVVPVEICDGIDNDCDGQIDEGVTNTCGTCGVVPVEICDGIDNDCDGQIDEDVTNVCGTCGVAVDTDGDGTPDCKEAKFPWTLFLPAIIKKVN